MKKQTNKILFIGVAIILVGVLVLEVVSLKRSDNIQDEDSEGKIVTEERDLPPFSKIVNEAFFDIKYVQSEKSQVVVTADESEIKFIETDVYDGELEIYSSKTNLDTKYDIIIYSPNCSEIKNEGVGMITCDSISSSKLKVENEGVGNIDIKKISGSKLNVENDGVGSINLESIAVDFVYVENNGLGNITLSGKTNSLILSNEGVGRIDAYNVESSTTSINNNGSGTIITSSTSSK